MMILQKDMGPGSLLWFLSGQVVLRPPRQPCCLVDVTWNKHDKSIQSTSNVINGCQGHL